jgi:hypothetical protein
VLLFTRQEFMPLIATIISNYQPSMAYVYVKRRQGIA